ncbi:MAG: NAD(P)-dependent oxidoreductase [Alphaproteobacteria bacterium]|nr:NAD(P)-dependent oxidoreductase [Alphaproteobacteria bacterium]
MSPNTIAILMPGDMGHGVGRALREHGKHVITPLNGRSDRTKGLAEAAGLHDVGSIEAAIREADLILSILPPASALAQAQEVADAMVSTGAKPCYVDCNAVSPDTAVRVGKVITGAGAPFLDCGIIGLAPGKGGGTRFYVSGADTGPMLALHGLGFDVSSVGDEPGRASALKMSYAGLTKGTWTLHTAVLMAAQQLGVLPELLEEFRISQAATLKDMETRVSRLPADSGRWVAEMEEIASTFASAGVTPGFHEGAAEMFCLLARTPFASETRETIDPNRTLEQSLAVFGEHLEPK